MKQDLKAAKKEMKNKMRPYQMYGYYFSIPIVIIVVFILSYLGIGIGIKKSGTIIFIFIIFAHVGASKLKLLPKRKYVAPILMYVADVIGFMLGILMFSELVHGGSGEVSLVMMGLIILPMEIIAIIFFFITANDIKKAYPTMKEDSKNARQEYLAVKKIVK